MMAFAIKMRSWVALSQTHAISMQNQLKKTDLASLQMKGMIAMVTALSILMVMEFAISLK